MYHWIRKHGFDAFSYFVITLLQDDITTIYFLQLTYKLRKYKTIDQERTYFQRPLRDYKTLQTRLIQR